MSGVVARLLRRLLGIKSPTARQREEGREAVRRIERSLKACGYERRS